jgi:uncharacterized protein
MRILSAALVFLMFLAAAGCARGVRTPARAPVIDVHVHAPELWAEPGIDAGTFFGPVFGERQLGIPAAQSTEHLQEATLAAFTRYNVVAAVVGGDRSTLYREASSARIFAGRDMKYPFIPADSLRADFIAGRYQVLAELGTQYSGIAPNDPVLEPYFALAEELDFPVGIHMGLGPPGAALKRSPKFRMVAGDPLLLEDVLARHPKLRLYVMHAGWPRLDEMIALMHAFPEVHADIAVINWYLPRAEFYRYLQRLVDAGFSKRIMFGSDQMVWPDAIGRAIEITEAAPFLSEEQRRDIMCRNAMRFLRLAPEVCGPE